MAKVYSTEQGRICPVCEAPWHQGPCEDGGEVKGSGKVRIRRETKGRKGAGVTLVEGVPLSDSELKPLFKQLKKKCSVGGTLKDGVMEFQGDQREKLLSLLCDKPWDVKISGG